MLRILNLVCLNIVCIQQVSDLGMELSNLQNHYDDLNRANDDLKNQCNDTRASLEEAKRLNDNKLAKNKNNT